MTDQSVTHEHIEQAFKPAAEVIGRLGDETTLTKEARRLLVEAERVTHIARETEKAKAGGE